MKFSVCCRHNSVDLFIELVSFNEKPLSSGCKQPYLSDCTTNRFKCLLSKRIGFVRLLLSFGYNIITLSLRQNGFHCSRTVSEIRKKVFCDFKRRNLPVNFPGGDQHGSNRFPEAESESIPLRPGSTGWSSPWSCK